MRACSAPMSKASVWTRMRSAGCMAGSMDLFHVPVFSRQ
jgi:hypothetical protein